MKKLLAVTAMAALVAGAAFAAPSFNLKTGKIGFDLATFDTDGNYSILTAPADKTDAPLIDWSASVKGEKTEASVGSNGQGAKFSYKPVDMLTLKVEAGKYGAKLELSPVTVEVTLPGAIISGNFNDVTHPTFKDGQVVKVTYAGGNIGTLWVQYTNKNLADFEVDYKNTFAGVTVESDTTINLSKNTSDEVVTKLGETLTVNGKLDTVSYKVVGTFGDILADTRTIGVEAHAELPVSDMTLYCDAKDTNVLANPFAMTAGVGLRGSLEVIGWDVSLQADVNGKSGSTVAFSIPVVLSASF